MSAGRVKLGFVATFALALSACGSSSDKSHGHALGGGGGAGATGGTHTGGSGGTVTGGTGASGGTGGTGGSGGSVTGGTGGGSSKCGNGVADPGEECDGSDLNGRTCQSYGFTGGSLACSPSCQADTTGCTGAEICSDGVDNDGDGQIDCSDSDCTAACGNTCASPPPLLDPGTVSGSTTGHADSLHPACSGSETGPDVAYAFTAAHTGVFEAIIGTTDPLTLSARSACSASSNDLGCTSGSHIKFNVNQGDQLFVVVDGILAGSTGTYQVQAQTRVIACGDHHTDGSEQCDDGNTANGDGCSASCQLESSEVEPNGSAAQANALVSPFFGSISPAGDVDFVAVDVTTAGASLSASINDLGDGSCALLEVDSYLEIRASDGTTVLASDNDSGEGLCSTLNASGLAAGKYYVVVSAAASATPPTFVYALGISVN